MSAKAENVDSTAVTWARYAHVLTLDLALQ